MPAVFFFADGVGNVGDTSTTLVRWIRRQQPALIVYGGDVYDSGTVAEFQRFFRQMDENVADLCEVAGNHDWESHSDASHPDRIPVNYEAFWSRFPPPLSHQPIDASKRGGARYDHVKDIADWRLVFVDTGPCNRHKWPMNDDSRRVWLNRVITETPGRAKIVFAHHSRLSKGKHGDIDNVDPLWRTLFDARTSRPFVAMTIAGHDHNVSVYDPRPMNDPGSGAVPFANGIHVVVNGAGGEGRDMFIWGSSPDFKDRRNFCVTKIDLISPTAADVSILGFGSNDPPTVAEPTLLKTIEIRLA